ncbi:MAG: hypothetical protein KAU24_01030, partial [Candidatus Aenigmarchaeota archaeon]|nr:hypothetical protein [Candidatus Aenigmarchaeota archaeon]
MDFGNALKAGIALILLLMLFPYSVSGAPSSYIRENVSANYFPNGTMDGNVTTVGYIEVDVETNADVLQYIVLQLSNISGTNLQSDVAYRNVAASPYTADRTRIYVNTTRDSQDIVYNITDPNIAAIIRLSLDYQNSRGGVDIYSGGTNTFNFNLTMNTTKDVYNVIANIRFSKDTLGMNDAIDLYNPSATEGSSYRIDSDWDGFYDIIRWEGNLLEGSNVFVTFQGNTTPGVN